MISRMSSMPGWEAASISITSMCRPSEMARHGSQTLHGVIVGPPCPYGPMQFSALAISRAVEVLPTPRTPVSRKAWAMRPRAIALASVWTIASWPISSAKVCGRYLRASTRYGDAPDGGGGAVSGRSSPRPGDSASSIADRLGPHCPTVIPALSRDPPFLGTSEGKVGPDQVRGDKLKLVGGSRRPGTKSLWLLPSGSDQVGDSAVRRLPSAHMVDKPLRRKFSCARERPFICRSLCRADSDFVEGSPNDDCRAFPVRV